ncbi:uncharacterized protein Triagg1_9113 [Trichoderma aggressivum f. europaeum]|uniref:Uncharacterized protein n=1 Tax=Trichoderma aggressivum f. europaeum TaxID=173218 RepID=A0AAE1I916_9HYPO|nr:hypothetical protein Triagg1_9113 [Trichoderma aggressivum f. europaeum]
MAKRKAQYNDIRDPPPQPKRIKSSEPFIQCGHFRLNLANGHSPPLRPASLSRFSKRKLSQFSLTEPSNGPSTKRRRTTSRDSAGCNRDSSPTDSPVESDIETSEYDSSPRPPEPISSGVEHPPSEGGDAIDAEAWPDQDGASGEDFLRALAWPGIEDASAEDSSEDGASRKDFPRAEARLGLEDASREDALREDAPGVVAWTDPEDSSEEDSSAAVPPVMEAWPDRIDSPPREPNPVWAFYDRLFTNSHRAMMIREEERRNGREQIRPRRRAQLPSPAPSDGGTGGSNPTSTGPPPASHTAPEPPASPTVRRRRLSLSPEETKRPSRQSPRRRQPRRKSRQSQGQPQEKPSPAVIEDFLQSKRASRRNVEFTPGGVQLLSESRLDGIPVNLAGPGAAGSFFRQTDYQHIVTDSSSGMVVNLTGSEAAA